MSNRQSQPLPWFRYFLISRSPTAPGPPPRRPRQPQESPSQPSLPAVERPATNGVASAVTSPATKSTAHSASVPSSPARSSAVIQPPVTATAPSTAPSPRDIKHDIDRSPPNSSKSKPQAPPPSPLALRRIHMRIDVESELRIPTLEFEKTVLVEKTIEKAKTKSESQLEPNPIAHALKQKPFKALEIEQKGHTRKVSTDSKGAGMRVITITGENQGATTDIFHLRKLLHKKGNSRSEENEWGNGSNEEKSHKIKDKNHNGTTKYKYAPSNAYINSNVQVVNNPIVIKSRCTHHDPGVHLSLSRKSDIRFPVKDQANVDHQS